MARVSKGAVATEGSSDVSTNAISCTFFEGLSNKEIAARFGLSEVTIKARMGRLYRKYGVSTRLQLLAAAVRRGLISADARSVAGGASSS
jgi:transposase